MSKSRVGTVNQTFDHVQVRTGISPAVVIDWLHAGVEDTHHGGWASLFYGLVFTVTGILIHALFADNYWLLGGLTTGFLLLGPFLAMGLYDLSRRIALGQPPSLLPSLTAWWPNLFNMALFAGVLLAALLAWTQLSFVIFAHFFNSALPTFVDIAINVITFKQPVFTLVYFAAGGLFAAFIFAISVIAIPLMLDQHASATTAALASLRACLRNPFTMLLWAFCIVVLVGVGFATSFLGLIVTMPVAGHASWHVYRDVIDNQR
ncbi:MAG TPA: DUF2189 domain-containing protein [Methylophilus sp.]